MMAKVLNFRNVIPQKMTRLYIIVIFFSTALTISCKRTKNEETTSIKNHPLTRAVDLIKIDFGDTIYHDLQAYVSDTITNDGWTIKYLVKDDSTKYSDIYIQCSKGNLSGIFHGKDLLQFRRYFIPIFTGETDAFIYFTHGCATDCSALLVFSKDSTSRFKDFVHIVDYNTKFNQVLYVTDYCYENESNIYDIALIELDSDKLHKITYNNVCGDVHKPSCVDTVIFDKNQVTINTTLRKSIESELEIKQSRTIVL
jgi:hypothetical protein